MSFSYFSSSSSSSPQPRGRTIWPEFATLLSTREWYYHVLTMCDEKREVYNRLKQNSLPITEIRKYKNVSRSQHECLVAEVVPVGQNPVYVLVEPSMDHEHPRDTSYSQSKDNTGHATQTTSSANTTATPTEIYFISHELTRKIINLKRDRPTLPYDVVSVFSSWPVVNNMLHPNHPTTLITQVNFNNTTLQDLIVASHLLFIQRSEDTKSFDGWPRHHDASAILLLLIACDHSSLVRHIVNTRSEDSEDGFTDETVLKNSNAGDGDAPCGPPIKNDQDYIDKLKKQFEEEKVKFSDFVLQLSWREEFDRKKKIELQELLVSVKLSTAKADLAKAKADLAQANLDLTWAEADQAKAKADLADAKADAAEAKRKEAVARGVEVGDEEIILDARTNVTRERIANLELQLAETKGKLAAKMKEEAIANAQVASENVENFSAELASFEQQLSAPTAPEHVPSKPVKQPLSVWKSVRAGIIMLLGLLCICCRRKDTDSTKQVS